MYAIVGAAGKVGYATSMALREAGVPVRAVLRNAAKARQLSAIGCDVALADLRDPVALGAAIADAHTVQIILPPALRAEDAVGDMRRSVDSLVEALSKARPMRVLAISDYGAHVGEGLGMPDMYHNLEQQLRRLDMQKVFVRSAEHIEGWGSFIPVAMATGILPSFHQPVDAAFPMVCARDVGLIAADLLLDSSTSADERIVHAEAKRRYSAADVAGALSQLLGRRVSAQGVPRSQWMERLGRVVGMGTARLLVDAYDAHGRGGLIDVASGEGEIRYGATELIDALRPLIPSR